AAPSGQSAIVNALLTYSALTGSLRHLEAAESGLGTVSWLGSQQPRFVGWALAAAEARVSGPLQVAVVGESEGGPGGGPEGGPLARLAWRSRPPGAVVVSGEPDAVGVPLLESRPLVAGRAAAYVCRGMVCDAPVTEPEQLAAALRAS